MTTRYAPSSNFSTVDDGQDDAGQDARPTR